MTKHTCVNFQGKPLCEATKERLIKQEPVKRLLKCCFVAVD